MQLAANLRRVLGRFDVLLTLATASKRHATGQGKHPSSGQGDKYTVGATPMLLLV
jgi:hypothetical protein